MNFLITVLQKGGENRLAMHVWKSEKEKCDVFLYVGHRTNKVMLMRLTEDEKGNLDILFTKFATLCKLIQNNITVERYHNCLG